MLEQSNAVGFGATAGKGDELHCDPSVFVQSLYKKEGSTRYDMLEDGDVPGRFVLVVSGCPSKYVPSITNMARIPRAFTEMASAALERRSPCMC